MPVPPPSSTRPGRQRLWQRFLDWEPSRHPLWQRLLVAALLTLLAIWAHATIAPAVSSGRFVPLILAATLSALYGGPPAGALSAVLGVLLANAPIAGNGLLITTRNLVEALWLNGMHLATQFVVIGSIGLMQRKQQSLQAAHERARKSQRHFIATFEQSAAGISHVAGDGRLLRVNQEFCKMVGYTQEELLNMRFQDITPPDDIPADEALIRQAFAGQRDSYTLEKRYIHRDGHLLWVKLTVALMRDEEGQPEAFISVVQDITEVKATNEALRTTERLMRQAAHVAGLIAWTVDFRTQELRSLFDSHQALKLPHGRIIGKSFLDLCAPEDRESVARSWLEAVKGRGRYRHENRVILDGQERWVLSQADIERDADGRAIRALGITYDITQRKQAELKVQELNASLEQRIRERTQQLRSAYDELESYSYAVAHDLRSPLRIINGFAQALKEDHPELDDEALSHLSRIMGASRQMGLLIDGLLQLSQYARGELQREPINISDMARQQLEDLGASDPQRQVEWSVEPGLTAFADPSLVNALLQNLLGNAWKYTATRTDAGIRVYGQEVDGQRIYCIGDNGAGFDMGRAAKLFQPFQRMHQPGEFQGLGIGLATARRIVERHGGCIRAESSPGQGATFCFSLTPMPCDDTPAG